MRNLLNTCVMLAKKFDNPKKNGETRSKRESSISSRISSSPVIPGKIIFTKKGIQKKATILVISIRREKKEKMELMNFFPPSSLFSILSVKNGTRTLADTKDPTV